MMGNWVGTSLTRDIASAALPRNTIQVGNKDADKLEAAHDTACVRSYRNITRTNFKVAQHVRNQSFYKLIRPIITSGQVLDDLEEDPDGKKFKAEENYIKKFYYEYFSVFIGNMDYKGPGSSIKKTSTNVQTQGSAYKIYGCGIMRAKDSINSKVQILIPLESIVIFN